jgi:hypothetical protein
MVSRLLLCTWLLKGFQERASRMETREQRLKQREVSRILQEEKFRADQERLERLTGELPEGEGLRLSERALKANVEKVKQELEQLQDDEDWFFDCAVCGVHGPNWVRFASAAFVTPI